LLSHLLATAIVTLAAALLLTPSAADAAVIVLKNGDRITGLVVRMQEKRLEIDPDYSSDNVTVDWEDVQSIVTERPMSIKLYGDVEAPENVGIRIRDRIILHSLEAGGPIRLEDVRGINLSEHDYYGHISAGGNQTTGNTQTQALNLSGSLTYRKDEHRFTLDAKYNRAQADNKDTANNGSFSIKYDYFISPRLYVGASNLTESDQFQDLSVRNTSAVTLGYDLIASPHRFLSIAAGPAAVYQDFTPTPATLTPSATWAIRYEERFRGDDVILWHKQHGFQDVGNGSAFRFNADQGIRVKIAGRWKLNLEYDFRYNSLPVAGKKTTDTNTIVGFSYDIKP
jgi:putative salt-induced outer membrane protein YdiY